MIGPFELLLAFALDCAIGDPAWLPHPVRIMGRTIQGGERVLRKAMSDRAGGVLLAAFVVLSSFFAARLAVAFLRAAEGRGASLIASAAIVYLASTTLAFNGLISAVREVYKTEDIKEARIKLSHIVGRDTGGLDRKGALKAALETLSENTSDGIIAPLFYLAVGGLPLAMAYKAVNTLDSMVGYKNARYREFGWASAKLDDAFNYIPARLTGLLIVAAACLLSGFKEAKAALGVMLRDGRKHASPNSGYPEAAMAGAVNVVFGGPSSYKGEVVEKPLINASGTDRYQNAGAPAIGIAALSCILGAIAASASLLWIGA